MFENIENLKILSSLRGTSRNRRKIENRPTHSFIIRARGSIVYDFGDKRLSVKEGEMIFLPKGSTYYYTTPPDTESTYTSINFEGDITDPQPRVYSLENFYEADYICNNFADLWKMGTAADKYKCISLFYSLLSQVSYIESTSSANKRTYELIDPAISYLKEHIYDSSLRADKLHRLCGISDTYFRKIFISRYRTTPQDFIISKRISHAKSIIENGDFDSIREVAFSSGFADPLYFSRVFKKIYGISPSQICK